ncbi:inovirus Gp2 family protein [Vibrio parahaemolyticus]|nr:inovirus Gp2 family protein [Vibrio parahaemolyticus]EJG0635309.1 inovirus Gp2 family protein [Vibrio parahaemolyticus]EJG0739852.1 inovirus Gp2 family protein [Vibrio parahaemolyticus]EJG0918409.1 inovirus Gp2 family protein [Vibrio parahaemolyticus]
MTNHRNKLLKQTKFKGINLITREKELIESRVSKIYEVLTHAIECFPRTFAFRVDLRFPHSYKFDESFPYMTKFFASLESQITEELKRRKKRQVSVSQENMRYIWCKEIDKSEKPHYHLVILLNKDNFKSLGDFKRVIIAERKCKHLYQMLLCAWSRVLGISLEDAHKSVYIPDNAAYQVRSSLGEDISMNHDFVSLFNRCIYLSKARTQAKGFSRTFGVGVKKSSNVLMANGNVISRS